QTRELRRLLARWDRRLVEEEQVDVGGEVELAPAQLAQREQRGRGDPRLAGGGPERRGEAAVGERRELAEARFERPAAEIARGDAQQALVLRDANRGPIGRDLRLLGRRRRWPRELLAPVRMSEQESWQEVARAHAPRQRREQRGIERAAAGSAVARGELAQTLGGVARTRGTQQLGEPALARGSEVGPGGRSGELRAGARGLGTAECLQRG